MESYQLQATGEGATIAGSILTVPGRWLKFLRRCLGLQPGRYILVLTVERDRTDWSVQEVGKIEK